MNIFFDKVYIISFIKNKENQIKIKSIIDNFLQITNYEFIYGNDFYALQNTFYNHAKHNFYGDIEYNIHGLSCSLAHFTAIEHALINNYSKILIIEDDVEFISDYKYIEYVFNNYPNDADIIKYSYVYKHISLNNEMYNNIYYKNIVAPGTQCYALCNKHIIQDIYNNYVTDFNVADSSKIITNEHHNNYCLKYMIGVDHQHKGNYDFENLQYPSKLLELNL